jgi:hypothetical protein
MKTTNVKIELEWNNSYPYLLSVNGSEQGDSSEMMYAINAIMPHLPKGSESRNAAKHNWIFNEAKGSLEEFGGKKFSVTVEKLKEAIKTTVEALKDN